MGMPVQDHLSEIVFVCAHAFSLCLMSLQAGSYRPSMALALQWFATITGRIYIESHYCYN